MTLSAGSIEARIGADIGDLERGVKAAEAALNDFARNADRALQSAFAGRNLSPAMESAARQAVDSARRGMDARLVGARDELARGLIDPATFRERARQAGTDASREISRSFAQLSSIGILPSDVGTRLSSELSDAARQAGEDAANALGDSFGRGIDNVGLRMENLGRRLTMGITLPIMAAGGAAALSAVRTGQMASALLSLEEATGLGVEAIQEYRRVALRAGVDTDQIADAAGRLQRRLRGVGEETADVQAVMAALGVSARDSSGRLRSMEDLLPELIRELQGIEDITLRNTMAIRLFGRGTESLAPVLGMASDAFDEARREAHELGLVLSRDALDSADRFRQEWETLSQVFAASAREVGVELAPVLTSLASGLRSHLVPAARSLSNVMSRTSPETIRLAAGIGAGLAVIGPATSATFGLVRAVSALRIANVALTTSLGPAGLIIAGLSVLSGWFVKNRLDALSAAGAVDEYRVALDGLSRHALTMRAAGLIAQEEALSAQIEEATRLYGAMSPEVARLVLEHVKVETELRRIVEHYNALGPVVREVGSTTEGVADSAERLAQALKDFPAPRELSIAVGPDAFGMGMARGFAEELRQARAALNEMAARGLIDRETMEAEGRAAGDAFNESLLWVLDNTELSPEVRATIQTMLEVELENVKVEPPADPADWRDFADGAAIAAQGVVNVADAFGDMSESTRRAITGISELSRSIGSLQQGPLMQIGNIGSMVGIVGGIAQIGASLFAGDPERARREQELTRALGDLRATMQGFRVTMSDLERAQRVQADLVSTGGVMPGIDRIALDRALERHGMSLMELERVAQEFGVSLYDSKGRLDTAALASSDFAEILGLAIDTMTGWRNTVGDARAAAELEAKLWGGSLTEPLERLQSEIDIFARFFAGSGIDRIDVSTEEGRDQMRALMQSLYEEFRDGTLDLQDLTREEFLSLFDGMADGLNAFDEAVRTASRGMLNVPPVFDLALRTRMAGIEGAVEDAIRPPPGSPGRRDPLESALDRLVNPVEGVTDSFLRAWEELSTLPDLSGWRVPDVPTLVRDYEERLQTLQVNIHNPPAGMDVREVTRQVTKGIVENLQRGGANELTVALRSAP